MCTQMRARIEKVDVLGWNKYNVVHHHCGTWLSKRGRELVLNMIHPGTKNWKTFVHLIIRKPRTPKTIIFWNSNYVMDKDKIKRVSGLVNSLGGTLLKCSSKTQRVVTMISTEAKYLELLECAQGVKMVNMLIE